MPKRECDAARDLRAAGDCSPDIVVDGTLVHSVIEIWYGMPTPAYACGYHASTSMEAAIRGHRTRLLTMHDE